MMTMMTVMTVMTVMTAEAQKPKTFRIAAFLRAIFFRTKRADTPLATCQKTRKISRDISKKRVILKMRNSFSQDFLNRPDSF